MIIRRVFAMSSPWTFSIEPIAELVGRYVGDGTGWVDPFAGKNSPAQFRNDMNPERNAEFHLEAVDFCDRAEVLTGVSEFCGILFDPPYSFRQVSEHYRALGLKATAMDTSANFVRRVKKAIAPKIAAGGIAISFGWNSMGFGLSNGFESVEYLMVCHGGSKNDTIVSVERKVLNWQTERQMQLVDDKGNAFGNG